MAAAGMNDAQIAVRYGAKKHSVWAYRKRHSIVAAAVAVAPIAGVEGSIRAICIDSGREIELYAGRRYDDRAPQPNH